VVSVLPRIDGLIAQIAARDDHFDVDLPAGARPRHLRCLIRPADDHPSFRFVAASQARARGVAPGFRGRHRGRRRTSSDVPPVRAQEAHGQNRQLNGWTTRQSA
jgi:hypothetical protein